MLDEYADYQDDPMYDDRYEDRMEARQQDMELLEGDGVTCEECGVKWDPKHHEATRIDPAYDEVDECPRCGGGPE